MQAIRSAAAETLLKVALGLSVSLWTLRRFESFGETWTDRWPGGCERRQTGGGALALAHGVVHVRGSGPQRCLEVRVLGFVGLR